jgi:endonuclease/exonuclease/phosphatase family metal-dependent hydrolase
VPAPLRVATYNVHAGVDGWGRPSGVVGAAVDLDADVLFLQETWRSERVDLAADIAARTGATARTYALGSGLRVTGGTGPSSWQPRLALLRGGRGLFLDSEHALHPRKARYLSGAQGVERGEWCVGIVTRLPILREEVIELTHLPRDLARRRLVHLTLDSEGGPLEVLGLHGAHLTDGSLAQYRELVEDLEERVGHGEAAVLGGDLNAWGVLARRVLRGWRHAGRGATWPSWRPHSQLDHLFVRGDVEVRGGGAVASTASDHRPMVASIVVRPKSSATTSPR